MTDEIKFKFWGIRNFPIAIKNQFLGLCKAKDIDWKKLLANLMREWMFKQKKGD